MAIWLIFAPSVTLQYPNKANLHKACQKPNRQQCHMLADSTFLQYCQKLANQTCKTSLHKDCQKIVWQCCHMLAEATNQKYCQKLATVIILQGCHAIVLWPSYKVICWVYGNNVWWPFCKLYTRFLRGPFGNVAMQLYWGSYAKLFGEHKATLQCYLFATFLQGFSGSIWQCCQETCMQWQYKAAKGFPCMVAIKPLCNENATLRKKAATFPQP